MQENQLVRQRAADGGLSGHQVTDPTATDLADTQRVIQVSPSLVRQHTGKRTAPYWYNQYGI